MKKKIIWIPWDFVCKVCGRNAFYMLSTYGVPPEISYKYFKKSWFGKTLWEYKGVKYVRLFKNTL